MKWRSLSISDRIAADEAMRLNGSICISCGNGSYFHFLTFTFCIS